MAYIKLNNALPGIVGLIFHKRETGKALSSLAQAVLRGPSPLSVMERELIASYVSSLNGCEFCYQSHSAIVNVLCDDGGKLMTSVINGSEEADISQKMKALLIIASEVQKNGKNVMPGDIQNARSAGATDEDIHDTVAVAAAFCFFNRYVDGLSTAALKDPADYVKPARSLIRFGYAYPGFIGRWMMKKMFRRLTV